LQGFDSAHVSFGRGCDTTVASLLQGLDAHVVVYTLACVHCLGSLLTLIGKIHCIERLKLAQPKQNVGLHTHPAVRAGSDPLAKRVPTSQQGSQELDVKKVWLP